VSRCLARDLEDRPESMKALEYELTRAIEGRASAVAAVMGLQLDAEATASASGSAPNPVAQADGESNSNGSWDGSWADSSSREKPAEPIVTVHDQAAARSLASQPIVDNGGRRKPWLWLGLGAVAVLAIVLMVRPELIPGLGPRDGVVSANGSPQDTGLAGTGTGIGTGGTGDGTGGVDQSATRASGSETGAELEGAAETGDGSP